MIVYFLKFTYFYKDDYYLISTNLKFIKKIVLIFLAISLTFACTTSRKSTSHKNKKNMISQDITIGSSYEKAIVIKEKTEQSGVDAEYAWLKENYPEYRMGSQSLNFKDGKPYDILSITTNSGKSIQVYFDISNFYGKF